MRQHHLLQRISRSRGSTWTLISFLVLAAAGRLQAAQNLLIWDTFSPSPDAVELKDRQDWKAVPREIFALEADPAKASSDPGYYGREYSFKGDVVVENSTMAAVFSSEKGKVVLYSKTREAGERKIGEIRLQEPAIQKIRHCAIIRNAADEVLLEAVFAGAGGTEVPVVFGFGKNEIIEVKPSSKAQSWTLACPLEYGIVPGFVGDDLIFGKGETDSPSTLNLPVENLFLGLLKGENAELVMTWPQGKQRVRLNLGKEQEEKRPIESLAFDNDGQSFYLAVLSAPGLWHREQLSPSYLEKDVTLDWKRPFPAKWQTQLNESGVRTTFAFREHKGTVWRGVPGSYNYPVWFEGENALMHLSKKVPARGEALIYFLEGQDTPASMLTPVDVLKSTLGRQMAETVIDDAGRKLRTHHRRGGDGVHRACTCGCTEAIQAVFESGGEVGQKQYVQEALGDMVFFVERHLERIDEYRRFADDTIKFLHSQQNAAPELKPYLENIEQIIQQIPREYSVQQENMKSLQYASELTQKTMALTEKKDPNNVAAYMELLKAWRGMGGAQDYVVAQCHMITRKLFQEAGYGCAAEPKALEVAQEIRKRCKQTLRNPDGYEIWPNY